MHAADLQCNKNGEVARRGIDEMRIENVEFCVDFRVECGSRLSSPSGARVQTLAVGIDMA